jgi:hypothetical protein
LVLGGKRPDIDDGAAQLHVDMHRPL